MTHLHQTRAYADFLSSIGWKVVRHTYLDTEGYYFLRNIPLTPFNHLKIQRLPRMLLDWDLIHRLEKQHRVYETVIEPAEMIRESGEVESYFTKHGFHRAHDFMLPTATRVIDLSYDKKALLGNMKRITRYNVRQAEKNELIIKIVEAGEVASDETLFSLVYDYLHVNARRVGMFLLPKSWIKKQFLAYGKKGLIFFVRQKRNETLLTLMTMFLTDDGAFYAHNGSNLEGRRLFAPTFAVWSGMLEAKRRNIRWFNFDGIYDERYPKSQRRFRGFSRFKSGFGGEEIFYCPLFRKWRWPA